MAYVVTGRCVGCKYTDCVPVCPCDCFVEVENPQTLVIDPETCIDGTLCAEACPIDAIFHEEDVPVIHRGWVLRNAELSRNGTQITESKPPLATALTLEQVLDRERH